MVRLTGAKPRVYSKEKNPFRKPYKGVGREREITAVLTAKFGLALGPTIGKSQNCNKKEVKVLANDLLFH